MTLKQKKYTYVFNVLQKQIGLLIYNVGGIYFIP